MDYRTDCDCGNTPGYEACECAPWDHLGRRALRRLARKRRMSVRKLKRALARGDTWLL